MIKNPDGWTDTNSTESHLRENGRIVGKVHRGYDMSQPPRPWPKWQACINRNGLRLVGERVSKSAAKRLVEMECQREFVRAGKERR